MWDTLVDQIALVSHLKTVYRGEHHPTSECFEYFSLNGAFITFSTYWKVYAM